MDLNPDKGLPVLREWELNENSTRFEQNFAAPSDQGLVPYWYLWTVVSLGGGLFVFTVFLGVASSKKTRSQSFNLYLLFLMLPDFTMEILCGITCLLSAIKGSYWSHWMCNFQSFYLVWAIGSNCWLNAIITYQIHDLLKCSQIRRRYKAPPLSTVRKHAAAIYLYNGFLASWGVFDNAARFPHRSFLSKGLACLPAEYDLASTFFFWLFFMPLFTVIPVGYVIYVAWDMKRSNLLPPSGRRRVLAIYFGRIIVVFLILWGPCILFNFLLASYMPLWMTWLAGTFGHLQGPVSAGLSLMKADVRTAVIRFLKCKSSEKYDHEFEDTRDSGNYGSGNTVTVSGTVKVTGSSRMGFGTGSSRPQSSAMFTSSRYSTGMDGPQGEQDDDAHENKEDELEEFYEISVYSSDEDVDERLKGVDQEFIDEEQPTKLDSTMQSDDENSDRTLAGTSETNDRIPIGVNDVESGKIPTEDVITLENTVSETERAPKASCATDDIDDKAMVENQGSDNDEAPKPMSMNVGDLEDESQGDVADRPGIVRDPLNQSERHRIDLTGAVVKC